MGGVILIKYTRYNIKRKKQKKYYKSIVLFAILVLAGLIVVVSSPFIFKSKDQTTAVNIKNQSEVSKNSSISTFILVQCGSFKNNELATKLKTDLVKTLGDSYIIQDLDSSRVVYGIYPESDGNNILKELSIKKIESSKMTFSVKQNDLCNKEIAFLINANLQVVNTLSNKNIKLIQTEDLKKWTSALKETDKKSLNYAVLQELKAHTLSMPKELTKSNIEENYIYLYNTLKKIK